MAVAKAGGAKGKCDKLFSQIIRFHGVCDNCDATCSWDCEPRSGSHRKECKLQCAHVVTRHISATRCDTSNAFSLCAKCHHYFTLWPVEFSKFVLDRVGQDGYGRLYTAAQERSPVKWEEKLEQLQDEWDRLRSEWGLV